MQTTVVFGSNGQIGKQYISQSKDQRIIGIDINHDDIDSTEEYMQKYKVDICKVNTYDKLLYYFDNEKIKIDSILFTQGINSMDNFFTSEIKEFENVISINLTGVFIALKLLYPYLNKKSSIVVIASQNGVVGHEDRIDYATAKAGLIHMVKNLTLDFAKYSDKDIKINALSPGYILNDNNREFFKTVKGRKLISKNPYNKIVTIDQVIDSINFLLSDASDSIRGQNIILDYGYTIQ